MNYLTRCVYVQVQVWNQYPNLCTCARTRRLEHSPWLRVYVSSRAAEMHKEYLKPTEKVVFLSRKKNTFKEQG